MNSEQIYEAITNLPEELPEEAAAHTFIKRKRSYWRWGAVAAAVALIPLAAAAILFSGGMGGMSSDGSGAEMAQDSEAMEDNSYGFSISYMDYAGPVFPLATLGGAEDLTADRIVTFDFSPYETRQETYETSSESYSYDRYDTEVKVTDAYVLANPTEEHVTVTAVYPFAAAFSDPLDLLPVITVDGTAVETALYAGPQGGEAPESWETYRAWLSDGSYREAALASATALDVPVTVYEFSALTAPESDAPNPTLSVRMTLDYDRTTVLSLGFDGGSWDRENGAMVRECSVPQEEEAGYGTSRYLIVLGEDVTDMTLRGCRSGGSWEEGSEELPGVTAGVRRYTSTLQTALEDLVGELYDGKMLWRSGGEVHLLAEIPRETCLDALTEALLSYGILSDDPAERSRCEILEDVISQVWSEKRVLYLTFPVTVPAGSSVTVTAELIKDASTDYTGGGAAREGYDLVTRLGSDLTFASQTARLAGAEYVEILRQNFGFDPERGVTEVTLDAAAEHYFIEVRKREG
ncbi:MAG: hypothetical protein ACI3W8_06005 [Oscillospiraceae bacterium]